MGIRSGNPLWVDHPDTTTPITAARLNAIEDALDATVEAVTGFKMTVGPTPPADPEIGDVWIDTN